MKQKRKSTPRPHWELGELDFLRNHYHYLSNQDLSKNLGRSLKAIMMMAQKMGLTKSHEYRREMGRKNVARRYDRFASDEQPDGTAGQDLGGSPQ